MVTVLTLHVSLFCFITSCSCVIGHNDIHKRQGGGNSPLRLDTCGAALIQDGCTSGMYQEYVSILAECNQASRAMSIQDLCRRNANGEACGVFTADPLAFQSACGNSPYMSCSDDCRSLLLSSREELGCCVSVLNRSSNFYSPDSQPFSSSLWSLCGVESLTAADDNQCTSSTVTVPSGEGHTCTDLNDRLNFHVVCKRAYIDSVTKTWGVTAGCQQQGSDYQSSIDVMCAVDEQGRYCHLGNERFSSQFEAASEECRDDANSAGAASTACSPPCVQALRDFVSVAGCCLNSEYNGTVDRENGNVGRWLSYEFWQRCDVASPGFCSLKLDESSQRLVNGATNLNVLDITLLIISIALVTNALVD